MRPAAKGLAFLAILLPLLAGASLPALALPPGRLAGAGFRQASPVIDEAGYWELVRRTRDLTAGLKGHADEEIKNELAGLADEWEFIQGVQTDEGQVIPVDHGYLLTRLRADAPRLDELTALFDSLLSAHDEHPDGLFSTAELESLHAILARPEFTWPEPSPNPVNDWFQRLWDRFTKWLDSILGDGPIEISVEPGLLPAAASILLAIILLFVFRTLFSDFISEARVAGDKNSGEEPLTSEDAFEKAQALSRGGDYRSAVRYLYLSSLLLLDERGLLRYDRTKTNREYLRSISRSPGLARPLGEVIEVFDDVWYGYHSLDEQAFRHYSSRVQELKENKG